MTSRDGSHENWAEVVYAAIRRRERREKRQSLSPQRKRWNTKRRERAARKRARKTA
jgi:hypothetical protein